MTGRAGVVAARPMYPADEHPRLKVDTSMGSFVVELFSEDMPVTCANVIALAREGFYNGTHVHRVVPNFGVQFGCPFSKFGPRHPSVGRGGPEAHSTFPLNDGSGAVVTRDKCGNIRDEWTAAFSNEPFTVCMANAGAPNTNGSQLFVNLAKNVFLDWFNPTLPASHLVIGLVVEGVSTLRAIEAVAVRDEDGHAPVAPILVRRVEVVDPDPSVRLRALQARQRAAASPTAARPASPGISPAEPPASL